MSRSERCRQLDRLGSKAFHPLVLTSPLERNLALAEHLVRQTSDGVHVDIVADDTLDTDTLADELERALLAAGLADRHGVIRTVTVIARDAATGNASRLCPATPSPQTELNE